MCEIHQNETIETKYYEFFCDDYELMKKCFGQFKFILLAILFFCYCLRRFITMSLITSNNQESKVK